MVKLRSGALRPVVLVLFLTMGLALLAVLGCGSSDSGPLSPEELEEKAQGIDKVLMCPICPGETIDQSQASLAKQMQAMVREKLAQGESREEIIAFFVDKYGPSILADPPKRGFNLLVWVVPPLVLALGGGLLVVVVRGMRRPPAEYATREVPLSEAELEPYLSLVDQDIRGLTMGGSRDEGTSEEKPDKGASERGVE